MKHITYLFLMSVILAAGCATKSSTVQTRGRALGKGHYLPDGRIVGDCLLLECHANVDGSVAERSLAVYVLLLPSNGQLVRCPFIFKTFDSAQMEYYISKWLAPGSVLAFGSDATLAPPPYDQIMALKAYCEKKGIRFDISA
jgi:hypothetical protein